ncbi:hypothetical protein GCM10008955_36090 [Deinococcus malanensis]|uniref:Antitoxin Xre/MbcA/ParS-like toxin-binding domain-containing protein n=1 Tax=Deinococcus malanensis TaxID=1706855 RepID=A0ABQ2F3T6_9DEIO|nr:hypothetical protein [Deinococcus malanensis]GGK39022.1 hypothetical protein GCM10008955_36090 [Deinococcus malanensis]
MNDPESRALSVPVDRWLLEELKVRAQAMECSVEELVAGVLVAYVTPPALTLDLEQLGEAMLEAIQAPQEHSELSMAAAAELLTRLQPFLPHDSATRALLGDELIEQLTGLPASAPTTGEAAARLAAVTGVCQLLTGGYSEAGVRRWWTRARRQLNGAAPLDLLTTGWTPDDAAFRRLRTLAAADVEFSAT